jgi:multicomponent Na+:H+ antiporter subunit F
MIVTLSWVMLFVLLLLMVATLAKAFIGPTAIDRLVSMNLFVVYSVGVHLLFSFQAGAWIYLDVALVFVLATCVADVAIIKFFDRKLER